MKRFLTLALLGFVMATAQAQEVNIRPPRPKVGVVLGGGGAKGAAHIGALKYIEEMGIPVDYVAGTSMGSILGGLYAMGYSPEEMQHLISNVNWSEYIGNKMDRTTMSQEGRRRNSTTLLNIPFSTEGIFDHNPNSKFINSLPSAYVNNSSLINLFNDLCVGYQEDMDFNDMPIPFACVATDIVTGEEIVLRSGNLPTAMRASMAIPGVFSPVSMGDMVLVDGGLVNNFPADVLKTMGADIIIGIEITSEKKITKKDIQSLPQLLGRLVTNSTSGKRKENRELCNIRIVPDISGYGMLSFTPEAIDTLVGRGYIKAAEYHDQLLAIKQYIEKEAGHPVSKELRAPKAHNLLEEQVLIRSIEFDNVNDRDSRWLMRKGGLKVGNRHDKDDIEHAVSVYRGTGCYDEITYTIKENDSVHNTDQLSDAYDLNIHMTPAKPHVTGVGLRYDTEEGAAVLFHMGLNEKKFSGSKLDFLLKLSYNPKLSLTYTYAVPSVANFSAAYRYRNEHYTILSENKSFNHRYQQQKVSAYISQFHLLNFSTSVGLSFTSTTYDLTAIGGENDFDMLFVQNNMLAPFVNLEYDNLDHAYFAKHGIATRLTSHFYYEPKNQGYPTNKYFDFCYAFQSYITPADGRLTLVPQVYGRLVTENFYFNMCNLYGGEIAGRHFDEQMPFIGLASVEVGHDNLSILRCDLRYNFYGNHYLTAMYNCTAPWSVWLFDNFSDMMLFVAQGAGLKYSYNSLLGPISLTAHWSRSYSENHFGAYFSFGYTF